MAACYFCGAQVPEAHGGLAVQCPLCKQPQPPPESDTLLGRVVAGKYRLEQLVGVGGMGRVYRAEQTVLGRTVAVKVIHPHLLGDGSTASRFNTEARAASRLNHPNSVSIFDFGRDESDGLLYLVMEFLAGRDLATVAFDQERLTLTRMLSICDQVLGALAEAHALGVIHRDLKPENIVLAKMQSGLEVVKVLDFGLATILETKRRMTLPGVICGTPEYMSPEQAAGRELDGRSDLYGLGVLLYEMIADRLPFEGKSPAELAHAHQHKPVPPLGRVAPQAIPEPLVNFVHRALAKAPADRFASAHAMQEALRDVSEYLSVVEGNVMSWRCQQCQGPNAPTALGCVHCGAVRHVEASLERAVLPATGINVPLALSGTRPRRAVSAPLGRPELMRRLLRTLREGQPRVLWLSGAAGSGKSAVLHAAARELASESSAGLKSVNGKLTGRSHLRILHLVAQDSERFEPYALLASLLGQACTPDALGSRASMYPRLRRLGSQSWRADLRKALAPLALHIECDAAVFDRAISELEAPSGDLFPEASDATEVVAHVAALLLGAQVKRKGPLRILIDDVELADPLSQLVLRRLSRALRAAPADKTGHASASEMSADDDCGAPMHEVPIALLFASRQPLAVDWPSESAVLEPLSLAEAESFLVEGMASAKKEPMALPSAIEVGDLRQPAMLRQLKALGYRHDSESFTALSLSDSIVARFGHLNIPTRELLQWLAVVPGGLLEGQLRLLAPEVVAEVDIDALVNGAWLGEEARDTKHFSLAGRWLRDVVYDLIPKERRRLMHQAVVDQAKALGLSSTEVMIHAVAAKEAALAVTLAERMARRVLGAGSAELEASFASFFLDFARSQALETGEAMWDRAVGRFSAALARALGRLGKRSEADAVLSETLHFLPRRESGRFSVRLAQAQLALLGGDTEQAADRVRFLLHEEGESVAGLSAVALARALEARVYARQGQLERAARCLETALDLGGEGVDNAPAEALRALFEVAGGLAKIQGVRAAKALLSAAFDLRQPTQAAIYALKLLGDWSFAAGDLDEAGRAWRQAMDHALRLGELGAVRRITRRLSDFRSFQRDHAVDMAPGAPQPKGALSASSRGASPQPVASPADVSRSQPPALTGAASASGAAATPRAAKVTPAVSPADTASGSELCFDAEAWPRMASVTGSDLKQPSATADDAVSGVAADLADGNPGEVAGPLGGRQRQQTVPDSGLAWGEATQPDRPAVASAKAAADKAPADKAPADKAPANKSEANTAAQGQAKAKPEAEHRGEERPAKRMTLAEALASPLDILTQPPPPQR